MDELNERERAANKTHLPVWAVYHRGSAFSVRLLYVVVVYSQHFIKLESVEWMAGT
jgi:hypothetical protein